MGKSMRETYFENFEKVQVPAENRRGFRTEYRYKGFWYEWDLDARALKRQKAAFLATELAGAVLYLAAALRFAEFNTVRLTAGLAVLSVIAWLAELWGVIRLGTAKTPMMVSDFTEIKNCITVGCSVRMVLLALGVLAGIAALLRGGQMSAENALVCLGHLLSAGASGLVLRRYTSLRYNVYKNENGRKA